VIVAALGITAVTVVQSSRRELYADPSLSGHFSDVNIGIYTDAALVRQDRRRLLASDLIKTLSTIEVMFVDVDGVGVETIVVNPDRGSRTSPVLAGRLPRRANEIAVSPNYLRQRHLTIGDDIALAGPHGARAFVITGTVVFPFAGTSALGEQLLLTPAGRDLLALEPYGYTLVAGVRDRDTLRAIHAPNDDLEACTTDRLLPVLGVEQLPGAREQGIPPCVTRLDQRAANLRELGATPVVLMVFLAVLGVAGLIFLLGTSMRRTRHDLAVLRALGFTQRQTLIAVLVQGTTLAALGAVLAIPIGIAIGRWTWGLTVDDIGLVDRPVVSIAAVGGVIAATLVVAVLVSAIPASRLAFRSVADELRVE